MSKSKTVHTVNCSLLILSKPQKMIIQHNSTQLQLNDKHYLSHVHVEQTCGCENGSRQHHIENERVFVQPWLDPRSQRDGAKDQNVCSPSIISQKQLIQVYRTNMSWPTIKSITFWSHEVECMCAFSSRWLIIPFSVSWSSLTPK